MTWIRDKTVWLFGGLLAVIMFLVTIITLGRVRPKKPVPRPELDDVTVPKAKVLDTKPYDDYVENRVEPDTEVDAAIARLNDRHD